MSAVIQQYKREALVNVHVYCHEQTLNHCKFVMGCDVQYYRMNNFSLFQHLSSQN